MRFKLAFLALAALLLAKPALAETMQRPSGAIVPPAALMCWNGVTNADGSQQVIPCGTTANPVPVTAGPYSYSPSSTANSDQHNLAITTATALTVPSDATNAQVCVTGTKVNYRWDGTAPSASVGQPLLSGQCIGFQGRSILTALQFIQTAATATLDVTYSK